MARSGFAVYKRYRENLRGILDYCIDAEVSGIICFGMGLTLRDGNREYFYKNLDRHFPGLKQIYQRKYGFRYELKSDNDQNLWKFSTTHVKSTV